MASPRDQTRRGSARCFSRLARAASALHPFISEASIWLARRIAEGEHPIAIFRTQAAFRIAKLARATGIEMWRLIEVEGRVEDCPATDKEIERIAAALKVAPALLISPTR